MFSRSSVFTRLLDNAGNDAYGSPAPTCGCSCCQPDEVELVAVAMTCEDGAVVDVEVSVPASCACRSCASATTAPLVISTTTTTEEPTTTTTIDDYGPGGYGYGQQVYPVLKS
jgi:hypothetical protein